MIPDLKRNPLWSEVIRAEMDGSKNMYKSICKMRIASEIEINRRMATSRIETIRVVRERIDRERICRPADQVELQNVEDALYNAYAEIAKLEKMLKEYEE